MPSKLNKFEASLLVDAPLKKVFPFFSDPRNLERLTPPFLRFKVLSRLEGGAFEGQVIDYSLRVHGLPMRWRTLISQWQPPHRFVDVAAASPYAFWHHEHLFEARGKKTLLTDKVQYSLPFGALGDLLAGAMVRRDVESIFKYRLEVIRSLF